jgi:hypothetical protein
MVPNFQHYIFVASVNMSIVFSHSKLPKPLKLLHVLDVFLDFSLHKGPSPLAFFARVFVRVIERVIAPI